MATTLYFRNAAPTNCDHAFKDAHKVGTRQYWSTKGLSTSQGTSAVTATATSVTGPTAGLGAGGTIVDFGTARGRGDDQRHHVV